jgi:hypothetical protein
MDEQNRAERAYTELLQRVPPSPLPLGFRDAVMRRIGRERAPAWEWLSAAVIGLPNLVFLVWELTFGSGELPATFEGLMGIFASEEWSSETTFSVDGMVLLALALVGFAAMLMTRALVIGRRGRATLRSV